MRLAGVDFDLRGRVQLASEDPNTREFPRRISQIRFERTCTSLQFLHGACRSETDGKRIGIYVVHFANGQKREVPIIYGQNIRAIHVQPDESEAPPGLVEAWTGGNADETSADRRIRLFKAKWKNPWPEAAVRSIEFASDLTKCAPFLVAITAEP